MSLSSGRMEQREQDIGRHCEAAIALCRSRSPAATPRAFVADNLPREYRVDKAGARKALFGCKARDERGATGPPGPARR